MRTSQEVEKLLQNLKNPTDKDFKNLSKEIINGEDCCIDGYLVTPNNFLGRSLVFDLNSKSLKQVDQRNIKEFTFNNILYHT